MVDSHRTDPDTIVSATPIEIERIQSFYRNQAHIYDATRWISLRGRTRAIRALDVGPAERVLEIGCGTGANFDPIVAMLDSSNGSLVGVDFSRAMLSRAERRIQGAGWSNVRTLPADATKLDMGDHFDKVFLSYALSIIPDWSLALERAVDHVRPGGKVVVVDFGDFASWGPIRGLMYAWLRANHTSAGLTCAEVLRRLLGQASVETGLGGYYQIVSGTR